MNNEENREASAPTHKQEIDLIGGSCDMNLVVYLRNMQGKKPELGDAIRDVAEKASRQERPLRVLEVVDGVPLKALQFQENALRTHGDYMEYREGGSFQRPSVKSTVISRKDYLQEIFDGEIRLDNTLEEYLMGFLNEMMGFPGKNHALWNRPEEKRRLIGEAYAQKKSAGEIDITTDIDLSAALQLKYTADERYDLIFPDLTQIEDHVNCLRTIQELLDPEGYAFIPIHWWRPRSYDPSKGKGVEEMILLNDIVRTKSEELPLEDFLAYNLPSAFQIAYYPRAKTLVVRGTDEEIEMPQFSSKIEEGGKTVWSTKE